ncbi:mannitol-1-phosphate 5-dehydrogenase [Brenneria roseae subsp. roseae]|uniref:mannitol-1-phosphate 5-dehydrogenase n=1 Tax=Brenneria roseae TaxID=1509241 RepID=UPI000D616BC7|nr:mannitol-1-phosphate 5-dehydrogenase [Brenneria roseae]PWC22761.1 mannitol-1-phosphate 5-dehydrogenase [Brenneria roseae subsp. roseae]
MKKAIHFGAGNIGRGFIALNLTKSGYEVVFVDINNEIIDEINHRKTYTVNFVGDQQSSEQVTGVSAINIADESTLSQLISEADLITTAIGPHVLPVIAPSIAKGLAKRVGINHTPVNIIACENMVGGSSALRKYIRDCLDEDLRETVDMLTGFPDAAVDRIVPVQHNADKLLVNTEPYQEWDVNRSRYKGEIPEIAGLSWVDDLTPYIERKLYTINTTHTAIAWLGALYGYPLVREALKDERVLSLAKQVLAETAAFLIAKHGFDPIKHQQYLDTTLVRFANPWIDDAVARVGRAPVRKISHGERLMVPMLGAYEQGIEPKGLAMAIAAACLYHDAEDAEAEALQEKIIRDGLSKTLQSHTGLSAAHPLLKLIEFSYAELKSDA